MRENRLSGSEGGATLIWSSLPLSIIPSLWDQDSQTFVHIFRFHIIALIREQPARRSLPEFQTTGRSREYEDD